MVASAEPECSELLWLPLARTASSAPSARARLRVSCGKRAVLEGGGLVCLITSQIIGLGPSGGQELPKLHPMILTQCAVCATELGLTLGKKCGRCSTRYCGPECQKQHWEEGGHDKLCKKIKKAGGAEQYNANNKYAEAVAVAAKECADDTKGQTCYICTQALHWKTKEGLVRMCACRGTAGFAHVSCLAEQAKILFAEAEENNLDWEVLNPRFEGGVAHVQPVRAKIPWRRALRARVGVLEDVRGAAGGGLVSDQRDDAAWEWFITTGQHHEDALFVQEAELSMRRRIGDPEAQHSRCAGQSCDHLSTAWTA